MRDLVLKNYSKLYHIKQFKPKINNFITIQLNRYSTALYISSLQLHAHVYQVYTCTVFQLAEMWQVHVLAIHCLMINIQISIDRWLIPVSSLHGHMQWFKSLEKIDCPTIKTPGLQRSLPNVHFPNFRNSDNQFYCKETDFVPIMMLSMYGLV